MMQSKSIPELGNQLRDSHWLNRRDAAKQLSVFGTASSLVIPELSKQLEDTNVHVRDAAAETLGSLSKSSAWRSQWKRQNIKARAAVSQLTVRLADPGLGIRRTARNGLDMLNTVGSFGDLREATAPAVPELIKRLHQENWHIREAAALTLGELGPNAVSAAWELGRCLADESYCVRRAAKESLEKLFKNRAIIDQHALGALAVPDLVKRLDDQDWKVRVGAAWGLGFVGGTVCINIRQLVQELQHDDWGVRWIAAEALGNMGAAAAPALPEMTDLLEDPDHGVRDAVRVALQKFRGSIERYPSCITPEHQKLIPKLTDNDIVLREEAVKAVIALGRLALPGLPLLVDILINDKRLDVYRGVRTVFESLRDLGALGSLDERAMSTPAIPALLQRLRDENWVVRLAAAEGTARLVAFASRMVLPMMEHRDKKDTETAAVAKAFAAKQMFRRMAKKATMKDIEDVTEQIAPILIQVADEYPDPVLRETAQVAIRQLELLGFDFGGDYDGDGNLLDEDGNIVSNVAGRGVGPSPRATGASMSSGRRPSEASVVFSGSRGGSKTPAFSDSRVLRTKVHPHRGFQYPPPGGCYNPSMQPWRGGIYLPPRNGEDVWVPWDPFSSSFYSVSDYEGTTH